MSSHRPIALVMVILSAAPALAQDPKPLAEGQAGVVVGTTGARAVQAGVAVLKQGGTAADAAMAVSLCQVVECGGAYVSAAGILGMTYYDAASGKVAFLNAGYDTARDETDPMSIPTRKASGRSALVPGFMKGVEAAHEKFGKLPRKDVFAPAIALAEDGFKIEAMLAGFVQRRKDVLSRLPETKRVFTRKDGTFYALGDEFRQPDLAATLRRVSEQGADYMHTGEWAKNFVAAVQAEGGKISLKDLAEYRVVWEDPLRVTYRGHDVAVPGITSVGGVTMVEALHLLALADLPKKGPPAKSAESLFWLMQIGHCQALGFVGPEALKSFGGRDLSPAERVKPETAAWIWERMREGKWPLGAKLAPPPGHSDGVVVVDQWGNVAAVTHSINTVLWGDTGIFVGGISIPDSAAIQQAAVKRAGPGKRLPDPMCPLIVLRDGKPVLGSSAIGGGLHQRTLQVLSAVYDFGLDAQAAADGPAFLLPEWVGAKAMDRVEQGQFDARHIDAVIALGQPVKTATTAEAGGARGYWVGVQIDAKTGTKRAAGTRGILPVPAAGY